MFTTDPSQGGSFLFLVSHSSSDKNVKIEQGWNRANTTHVSFNITQKPEYASENGRSQNKQENENPVDCAMIQSANFDTY